MVLDGELEPATKSSSHRQLSDQERAVHSLYLHSRELLSLTKLADACVDNRREELLSDISQQIKDCQTCLELAYKRRKFVSENAGEKEPVLSSDEVTKPLVAFEDCEPVIDQIFVTEECDGKELGKDEEPVDDDYAKEARLRRDYETFLMRELKGVIHELAKERISRESQLSQTEGKSVEQIAKITRQIVENRDIKGLVKSAAQISDSEYQAFASDEPIKSDRRKKYEHAGEHIYQQCASTDMAQMASVVASQFVQQHEDEETFGSTDSETSDEEESELL